MKKIIALLILICTVLTCFISCDLLNDCFGINIGGDSNNEPTSAYDQLNDAEKRLYEGLIAHFDDFADPSSVKISGSVVSYYQQTIFYVTITANNNTGSSLSVKVYVFAEDWTSSTGRTIKKGAIRRQSEIEKDLETRDDKTSYPEFLKCIKTADTDVTFTPQKINAALDEYKATQGW